MPVTARADGWVFLIRCDVCGLTADRRFGRWQTFGPTEGDGVHTCSDECRAKIADPEKAFAQLFKMADLDDGKWPVRKHSRLLTLPPAPHGAPTTETKL